MVANRWPLGELVRQGPQVLADGRTVYIAEYRHHGPDARPSGRRIVVKDEPNGTVLFDTDECYDRANAADKVNQWLASQEA